MQWLPLVFLCLLALMFISLHLWRPVRRQRVSIEDEVQLNNRLYADKVAELDAQVQRGEMTAADRDMLLVEFQRQLLRDNDMLDIPVPGQGNSARWLPVAAMVLVPVLALGIYHYLGAAQDLTLQSQVRQRAELLVNGGSPTELAAATEAVIGSLKALAQRRPDNPLYPVLLARLSQDQGEFATAVTYYQQAVALLPQDGMIHAEYAQALFFAEGNQVTPRVKGLAELALSLDPGNDTALGLLGIEAFHREDYRQAITFWQQALAGLAPMAPSREYLMAGITQAQEKLAARGESPESEADSDSPLAGVVSLTLDVSLDDQLDIPADTTVFIYARAVNGSPMPLAIRRLTRADLPTRVTLDETMAMSPTMTLASVDQVELVARVSFAGSAMAASGDYEGVLGPVTVANSQEPLALVIDRRIP